jgi:hypothetical protein
MKSSELDLAFLSTIPFRNILKYFQSYDWQLVEPSPFTDIVIMRKNIREEQEEILIPRDQSFADFNERIFDAIDSLAKFENKVPDDIISDLLSIGSDVLRLRISGNNVQRGIISFLEEMNIKEGLKKILLSVACQILDPRPFYKKLHRAEAEQLIRHCKIGQPENGSFIIKFYFPSLDSNYVSKTSSKSEKPFARRVAEQLMISLQDLVNFIENKKLSSEPHSNFNANFCFGLVEMKPSESLIDLDFQVSWSKEVCIDRNIPTHVKIQDNYIPTISKIGEYLKPQQEITQSDFIGKITGLHGSKNEEGKVEGDITLAILVDEESKKVKAYLGAAFYSQACDAHKNGKYVQISGMLKEKPRFSILEKISNFEVVSTL